MQPVTRNLCEVTSEHQTSPSLTRELGLNQRVLLALACQLWICANIFPRRSNLGFCIVSLVQLIAVILIYVRLRHSPRYFRARTPVLGVVLFITGVDLFIALWQLSGRNFPLWIANLGPVELAAAVIAYVYCIVTKPTRLTLLLYTITFVAGTHAVALTLALFGAAAGGVPSADFSPFVTAAKTLSIFELVISLVYPVYFVLRGRYARQFVGA
jgi:hypothetical protein